MRDYLILALILAPLPFILSRPHLGVLVWMGVSLMNPHRYAWGMAYNFPVAAVVGGVTLAAIVIAALNKSTDRFPAERETWLLLLLWLAFTLSTLFAFNPTAAWPDWSLMSKTLLLCAATLMMFQSRKRLMVLLAVMAVSIGVYGVKGGLFGLATGGQYIVFGPPESFIGDNNGLALAELMVLPILIYLGQTMTHRYVKLGFYGMAGMTTLSIVLSYSRGAFLALAAMAMLYVFRASNKMVAVLFTTLGLVAVLTMIPDHWFERMWTIADYEKDASAMSRINGYIFAYRLASDFPLTGGGFGAFNRDLFFLYAPHPEIVYDGHSIFFQTMGEHGFLGFGIFTALLVSALVTLQKLRSGLKSIEDLQWARECVTMLQLSLVGYAVGGAFQPLAYFDLFYYLIAAVVLLKVVVRRELAAQEDVPQPAFWSRPIPQELPQPVGR